MTLFVVSMPSSQSPTVRKFRPGPRRPSLIALSTAPANGLIGMSPDLPAAYSAMCLVAFGTTENFLFQDMYSQIETLRTGRRAVAIFALRQDTNSCSTRVLPSRHAQPAAREVVGQAQGDQDDQPEQAGGDHERRQARAVAHVHEEQDHQGGLERGDAERDDV